MLRIAPIILIVIFAITSNISLQNDENRVSKCPKLLRSKTPSIKHQGGNPDASIQKPKN